jgi:5'-nucleotidase
MKPIIYIDMDGVVADFDKAFPQVAEKKWTEGQEKKVPEGFFYTLELIDGAQEALNALSNDFELYFLSTPQWSNPNCWKEKRLWVEKHFGDLMFKRLILTHNKGLLKGDYLIDDRIQNSVENFEGEHIHFGTEKFPNWGSVVSYIFKKEGIPA